MKGVIADANFLGQLKRLLTILESEEWLPYWQPLSLQVYDFDDIGLSLDAADRIVWERCQHEKLVLITGNRNDDGPDSLEAVIREAGGSGLPVFTISDERRVMQDGNYARKVAINLLEYMIDLRDRPEVVLGSGRIFLPKNPAPHA